MVKPEDGIKRRHFHDAHVTKPEDIVQAVMECLEVADDSAVSLVAHLTEWLIRGQKLVEHVAKVGLLLVESQIDFVITTGSVQGVGVEGITYSMIPILELEFALHLSQLLVTCRNRLGKAYKCCEVVVLQWVKVEPV
jgi:hypothetical protein